MGLKRVMRYFSLRIVRLSHQPEPLARAIACGIAVSFFPVFGIHALMGAGLAFLMRANMVAAALSTLLVPPVILPLVFSLDFLVGRRILRYFGLFGQGTEASFSRTNAAEGYFHEHFNDLFLPALIGSGLFMILVWPAVYMAAHKLIAVLVHRHHQHKARRRAKKAKKAADRKDAAS
ncbi:MAG: DUF2062 domain-containing protein [Rhodospirillales bacterium]|nr:DUF2062 domain-containing protein [Alphaproteobacteria bacterium]MCB9986858.1 DUF2062 domain-containing protein [Rhodospirillales bacterium]USO08381.1 MAG: DUF2062 domain-containing protein [Rhodospirillales bacterium]